MKVRSISYPDYHAGREVLRFQPPMRVHALTPARFDFAWKMLQYCFEFPDPATAVAARVALAANENALIARFVGKATSLAGSPFLGHRTEMIVRINNEDDPAGPGEQIETGFPHEESERGFLTLLRQFAHKDEEASFKKVQDIAIVSAKQNGVNLDLLKDWGKYHRKLLVRPPESWAYLKALGDEPVANIPLQNLPPVDQLLRTYFYGDVIHFGENRDELAKLDHDAFTSAHMRMTLYAGASALAMFYMGYATILERIYPEHG